MITSQQARHPRQGPTLSGRRTGSRRPPVGLLVAGLALAAALGACSDGQDDSDAPEDTVVDTIRPTTVPPPDGGTVDSGPVEQEDDGVGGGSGTDSGGGIPDPSVEPGN